MESWVRLRRIDSQCSNDLEIFTPRLRLREFAIADWPTVQDYQSDPMYLRYYEWTERTSKDVRDFVQTFVDWQDEQPRYRFQLAIELISTGKLIGNCGIRCKFAGAQEADIGYELAPSEWGQGYATETATALVDYGFREMSLHRISSSCISDNAASARVLEKAGLLSEGVLRESEYFKGRHWDTLLFAMLKTDWASGSN